MTGSDGNPVIIDGRYRVLERVGSGGMADVFCAEDLQLGRKVAVKLLHRRFAEDAEFVERFRLEASSAAGLAHPNVVAIYDRGAWDGTFYIAMEYLEGRTLKQIVHDEGPLPPERAAALVTQVLNAAKFAHSRNIIHRDLKPHNVIVGPDDRAKVTDFGIAKAGSDEMTETGSIMGTAQYLSPEQAEGKPVSAPSDLYSVGIILYELLTGHVPFEGDSAVAIALKHMRQQPPAPSQSNAAITAALDAVVLRALAKEPGQRYQNADEFLEALERALHEPQQVAPPPPPPPVTGEQWIIETEDVATEDEHEGGSRWWIALLAGLLVLGLIAAFALISGREKVKVPGVVGQQQKAAQARLAKAGFSTDVQARYSLTEPPGTVIGQDPEPGAREAKGSTVTLSVSNGPGTAKIPDLRGKSRNEARRALEKLRFRVSERRAANGSIGENRVISSDPGAGETVERGTTVTLAISTGPPRVEVPDVTGQSLDEATATLTAAGFKVGSERKVDEKAEPGSVLSQTPAGGSRAAKGSVVTLSVAKAPDKVEIPDVTGEDRDPAEQALRDAGFQVSVTEQPTTDESQDGIVVSQNPSGRAKKGSRVTLVVGRFEAPTDTTPTDTTPTDTTPTEPVPPPGAVTPPAAGTG